MVTFWVTFVQFGLLIFHHLVTLCPLEWRHRKTKTKRIFQLFRSKMSSAWDHKLRFWRQLKWKKLIPKKFLWSIAKEVSKCQHHFIKIFVSINKNGKRQMGTEHSGCFQNQRFKVQIWSVSFRRIVLAI